MQFAKQVVAQYRSMASTYKHRVDKWLGVGERG